MKVLHIFNEIKYSGAELMYVKAAKLFQEQGIQLLAFNTGKNLGDFSSEFENNKIKVYHKPINSGLGISFKKISFYREFYRFLRKEQIDIIHIHRSDLYLVAFFAHLAGVRTIKTMHNVFKNRAITLNYARFKRLIYSNVFNIVFQTIGKSVYENELNYYKNKSVRINNWFDPDKFYPVKTLKEKENIRNTLGLQEKDFIIISVGGCSDIKNHHDIIRALEIVAKKINCFYLHLGKGKTESEELELVRKLKIENKVRFVGNTNNVRQYLIASDVYIMTSKFEGLSIAGIEAMACGLPLIFYKAPGLKDLIINNNNGFLIDPDFKILASKIDYFYQNSSEKEKKGVSAINFVKNHFSMNVNVNRIVALYKNKNFV